MSVDHEERLRRLALHDDHLIRSMLAIPPGRVEASGLDPKSCALVRLGALLALDAACVSYQWGIQWARAAGATTSSQEGETIYEIGWMVLPEFRHRGIASQAVGTVLDKARAERKFGRIHAFPAVTNGTANKICEKHGFANLGPRPLSTLRVDGLGRADLPQQLVRAALLQQG
jgi:predicted GNAT family acetyltransferase